MKLSTKISTLTLAVAITAMAAVPVDASGSCPSQKNGKCPQTKKTTHSSSQYTAAQKAKMMDEARAICRKRYGAASHVYQLDYYHWKVWCTEPGY